ncbi:MAG: glycosyltransferase family 8 protein [Allosphingosinicella sp.]
MPAGPIEVALCFDDHLALPGAVAILSLLRSREAPVRVHVLADPDSRAAPILRAMADRHDTEIRIVEVSDDRLAGCDSASDYGRPSIATYRRLLLADLLPDVDRLIYLDADLMVRRDLTDLWNVDFSGAPLAAVRDPWMATVTEMRDQFPAGYFNAGVMLFDLVRWREEGLSRRCLDEIERCRRAAEAGGGNALGYRNEQTPMNEVLRGRWRALPPEYNSTAYLTPRLAHELDLSRAEYADAVTDPAVVHFLGSHKPWTSGFERLGPWHREYQRVREAFEAEYDCSRLAWPLFSWNGVEAAQRRRLMAMRLVASAKMKGFERPVIVLTGLLGEDLLVVAREQQLPVACFASESPAHAGGELHGIDVVPVAEAIDRGHRDFILGDYRRRDRTRAWVEGEARASSADLRILDVADLARLPT